MRHAHRSDCDDRCNGDWCECPCHQVPAEERWQADRVEDERAAEAEEW